MHRKLGFKPNFETQHAGIAASVLGLHWRDSSAARSRSRHGGLVRLGQMRAGMINVHATLKLSFFWDVHEVRSDDPKSNKRRGALRDYVRGVQAILVQLDSKAFQ
ncbi:uncharacterized protein PGTG_20790 [Puccinia graminis f. sp. tritici CRL 75-36-700-3]|uniref:Uncharacterized protein n=1 Tax=Puccinia graminis f. sp. tritici (strain CRL 75-36-700-3 / race SCCL) TaxID=418459 RepID=H6QPL7_PUCGT|nr:uncharacterized protein PGTG_20790 [Puccinia graminis f. sp. tritici CRL 75-36-700-3]EHS64087.1 hypothetical protein PGTG_20790 [Puccinia graminis f. sp. tritici CRL 75-36-700-3]